MGLPGKRGDKSKKTVYTQSENKEKKKKIWLCFMTFMSCSCNYDDDDVKLGACLANGTLSLS